MGFKDALLSFSNLASGDAPTAIADNASANFIDQMPSGLNFSAPGGGSYVGMWAVVRVQTAFTSGGSATIQAVIQDAPDPSTSMVPSGPTTWTDRILGPVFTVGGATPPSINTILLAVRLNASLARYIRAVYRIGTAVMTAGVVESYLTPDLDIIDISMREVGTFISQAGQIKEDVGNGILAS